LQYKFFKHRQRHSHDGSLSMATDDDREEGFNPKRRLCPDGGCIGIIGADGRCTECGVREPGGPAAESESPAPGPSDAIPHGDEVEVALGGDGEDESGPALDPNRRLCGDGACLGVIDGDNRCPVCGKPAGS
jgi:hypothetical protein